MRLIHFLLVLLTSFLSPNHITAPAADTNRVVTQIEVTVIRNGETSTAAYTDSEQMEAILTYLRMTEPTFTAELAPDSFRADSYTFTLFFSDGSHTVYRQIYHDYLQKNDEHWRRISPKAGLLFPSL